MIGLVGLVSGKIDQRPQIIEAIKLMSSFKSMRKSTSFETRLCKVICNHHGIFDHNVMASDDKTGIHLILDGWLRGCVLAGKDAAEFCLEQFLISGTKFIKKLNGQFNISIWNERTGEFFLINDRYGLRPIQYGHYDGTLYFAPEAKAILKASGMNPKINDEMVLNYLSLSRIHLGNCTFFQGIHVLEPATILRWKDEHITKTHYWDYQYNPVKKTDEDFLQHLVTGFEKAVERWIVPERRLAITLSGGLDSRVVASVLARKTNCEVKAFTFGLPKSEDVQIARHVAERLGIEWYCIPLCPDDFVSHAEEGVQIFEGLDAFVQSYALKIYPEFAIKADIFFNGLALDLTLGGSYLPNNQHIANIKDSEEYLFKKFSCFDKDLIERIFRDTKRAAQVRDRLGKALAMDVHPENPLDAIDRIALINRVHRYIFQRQYWQRLFFEDATPTFDNDFVDLLLQIPAAERIGHRFYHRFLSRVCPETMDIPYQRTGIPPSVPVDFWPEAAKVELSHEKLLERIYAETGGSVYIPYLKYYSNFDEWLRVDKIWRELTDSLLLNRPFLCIKLGLDQDAIQEMVNDHRTAKRNHRQRLLQLMTLELTLKKFFS